MRYINGYVYLFCSNVRLLFFFLEKPNVQLLENELLLVNQTTTMVQFYI